MDISARLKASGPDDDGDYELEMTADGDTGWCYLNREQADLLISVLQSRTEGVLDASGRVIAPPQPVRADVSAEDNRRRG